MSGLRFLHQAREDFFCFVWSANFQQMSTLPDGSKVRLRIAPKPASPSQK
jgi:hypothetical protein